MGWWVGFGWLGSFGFSVSGRVSGKTKCAKCVGSKFFPCGGFFIFFCVGVVLVVWCCAIATNSQIYATLPIFQIGS